MANQLGNVDQLDKAAKYHNWVVLPLMLVTVDGTPFSVPRYLHLDLGKQTQRNVARFRLHFHALRVETMSWEHHDGTCDKCGLQAIQDEKHALFLCPCMQWLRIIKQAAGFEPYWRPQPAKLPSFGGYSLETSGKAFTLPVSQTGAFYFSQACSKDVFNFSRNKLMISIVLFQSLWMFFYGWCSPAT